MGRSSLTPRDELPGGSDRSFREGSPLTCHVRDGQSAFIEGLKSHSDSDSLWQQMPEFSQPTPDSPELGSVSAQELLPLVYHELRRLAAIRLAHERPGQTLQATALVHEAWLRLNSTGQPQWQSRGHFFAAAAEAIRRILVENARRKGRARHGGELQRVDVDQVELSNPMPDEELLELNEALEKLAVSNPRGAQLIKLCFFTGLTQEQAAQEMEISVAMAERTWALARAWLFREMKRQRKGIA